jgi:predicted dehydrogenase
VVSRGVAIIGCGLIGGKRARVLGEHSLVAVADTDIERAKRLAAGHATCKTIESDWRKVVTRDDVNVVIVATSNDVLTPATLAAVRADKHVLVEKPAARNAAELEPVVQAARDANVTVKVGFNHRFHPAIVKAREIFESGALGPMMFVRGRYGQGGRLGMEKEWRGNATIAGGGEMLDQGVHLIDLSRWFLGEFVDVKGTVARFFWDWDVEDNGFACLTTAGGQVAWLHASCTEWKNLFSLEIYGKDGKLHIEGLGGSYGVERLNHYKMLPQMGPPETTSYEYPGEDRSWHAEWEHFMTCIDAHRQPGGNLDDALAALRVVGALYDQSPRNDRGGRTT